MGIEAHRLPLMREHVDLRIGLHTRHFDFKIQPTPETRAIMTTTVLDVLQATDFEAIAVLARQVDERITYKTPLEIQLKEQFTRRQEEEAKKVVEVRRSDALLIRELQPRLASHLGTVRLHDSPQRYVLGGICEKVVDELYRDGFDGNSIQKPIETQIASSEFL